MLTENTKVAVSKTAPTEYSKAFTTATIVNKVKSLSLNSSKEEQDCTGFSDTDTDIRVSRFKTHDNSLSFHKLTAQDIEDKAGQKMLINGYDSNEVLYLVTQLDIGEDIEVRKVQVKSITTSAEVKGLLSCDVSFVQHGATVRLSAE